MTEERAIQIIKWGLGGLAVVAAFLLAQPDLVLEPWVKVGLGAFLAFAAYVNPASLLRVKGGDEG